MFAALKGRLSANLLASKSNHTVSRASLYFVIGLALVIALLSALFSFAQWQLSENLQVMQQARARAVEKRVAAYADMASQQANAHRATLNVLLSRDSTEFEEANNLRSSNLRGYFESSHLLGNSVGLNEVTGKLRVLTAQYEELSAQVVGLFHEGRREEALDLRASRLREAFNRWQRAHIDFSTKLAQTESEQKKDYDAATASARRLLTALLIAPIGLIFLGIAATAAILGLQRFGNKKTDVWSR